VDQSRLAVVRPTMIPTCCGDRLSAALAVLAPSCPAAEVSRIAALIDEAMSGPDRAYHTLPHALMVAESDDPIEILIGLFHDIVQLEVDAGIPPCLEGVLDDFRVIRAEESSGDLKFPRSRQISEVLPTAGRVPYRWTVAVQAMFRVAPGSALKRVNGHNEFLSALAAARLLEPWLDAVTMISLIAGIETTIPFRNDPEGSLQALRDSIRRLDQENHLGLDTEQLDALTRRAVRVANRDVRSFGEPDLAAFLGDTFTLLMESCPSRDSVSSVQIDIYRRALQKMTAFLSSISPSSVFRRFDDEPTLATHHARQLRTAHNLEVVVLVLSARLLSTLLLEAELGDEKPALALTPSPSIHRSAWPEAIDAKARELLSNEAGWRWRATVSSSMVEVDMLARWGGEALIRKAKEIQALVAQFDVTGTSDASRALRALILSHYSQHDREWAKEVARSLGDFQVSCAE
jgi:hypothetical protein